MMYTLQYKASCRTTWKYVANFAITRVKRLVFGVYFSTNGCARAHGSEKRVSPLGIQMLSNTMYKQIFKNNQDETLPHSEIGRAVSHLKLHNITNTSTSELPDVSFDLPKLFGSLHEHFEHIAMQQVAPYKELAERLLYVDPPVIPREWNFRPGWTKYSLNTSIPVPYPEEDVFILDVEVCVTESDRPILATAVSPTNWYSWVSERLTTSDEDYFAVHDPGSKHYCKLSELIPLQCLHSTDHSRPKLVIGHNVSYDRARIKEEYLINGTNTRFLDTLSLHVCVAGLTTLQKQQWLKAGKNPKFRSGSWMTIGVPNSLEHVYKYYCGATMNKEPRDVFVKGTVQSIREQYQHLMRYCAEDSMATLKVFQAVYPQFLTSCSHPVALAGMFEMGSCFLPTSERWKAFLVDTSEAFKDLEQEMKAKLMKLADEACSFSERYHSDPWYAWLDWTRKSYRGKRTSTRDMQRIMSGIRESSTSFANDIYNNSSQEEDCDFKILPVTSEDLSILKPRRYVVHMPGMPQWYRKLCDRVSDPSFQPGPVLLSAQTMISPYLLRMTWNGHPLYHHPEFGWGYLVGTSGTSQQFINDISRLVEDKLCNAADTDVDVGVDEFLDSHENIMTFFDDDGSDCIEVYMPDSEQKYKFHKLPHKNGPKFNVGNPLSKDFQNKMESRILSSQAGLIGRRILELNSMLSFWRISRDRIYSQFVVWYDDSQTQGAIIPKLITAGTATRRAVESTWLTASNAQENRVGSELKSVIEAPPGYCLVGADVDSQELWIASVLGDAHFVGMHGCTALGWMTLQGNKADGTDLHSVTAKNIGISRNHAKVLNYGRIYGAGKPFAILLLRQFNPSLSLEEAEEKAKALYTSTKGSRKYKLNKFGEFLAKIVGVNISEDSFISQEGLKKISQQSRNAASNIVSARQWDGGSESHTFNKLEEVANSVCPTTPVLSNSITKALQPRYVGDQFITSRINWVVQSSAVDYLHLLLVCMKWLFEKYSIEGRLCISIHDEVRYLVKREDKYRAALALQISNLLTRCMFASKLGIQDLPMSVAFFSAVDIDHVLRKEVNMDCKTPSNHLGLESGYKIPHGEALDIYQLLNLTDNGDVLYQRVS